MDVGLFARAVRGHWSVENACHWSLDVTFREDDSRIRERVLGNNIHWLYRFTLSILKQHPNRRHSLIMRRRLCGWSEKFLMEVISRVEEWRGGWRSVSTPRSSNRTGGFPASGSRTRTHAVAHEKRRQRRWGLKRCRC